MPPQRSASPPATIERRILPAAQFRASEAEGEQLPTLEGYAAVFGKRSELIWGEFVEVIEQGAFTEAIPKSDIRALINHDPNHLLGRTKSGTLEVSEDEIGLKARMTPPDTQAARDLMTMIRRGDLDQMSFSFTIAPGGVRWETETDDLLVRHIVKVDELFDVSPVTFPAYPDTSVAERELRTFQSTRAADAPLRRRASQRLRLLGIRTA